MADVTESVEKRVSGRGRRIALFVVAGLTVLFYAAIAPPDFTHPITGWLPDASYEQYVEMFYGEETPANMAIHRHHMLAMSLAFWTGMVGMAAQLRRPEQKQAPLWAAVAAVLVLWAFELAFVGFDPFTLALVVPVLAVLALHPKRLPEGGLSLEGGPGRIVAAVGVVVALVYGYGQIRLQIVGLDVDPHVADDHYTFMAASATVLAVAALLGASNLTGARITAWMVGLMAVITGAFFVGFPNYASSPGAVWGAVVILLGLAYLMVVARGWSGGEGVRRGG